MSSRLASLLAHFAPRRTYSLHIRRMSSTALPSTQLGVLVTASSATLQSFPVPKPGPGEVLIKNVAVASNPKDWKVPSRVPDYAFIEGNDVAGNIVAVGEGVTEYKGGEKVAAFTKMGTKDNKYGAYAEYTVSPASTTFPIPEAISYEQAATLPLAVMTSALALFRRLALPEPPASGGYAPPLKDGTALIINGASSSIGAYAIQLAKRAGLYVVGIAGASKQYALDLGADVVVDYREHRGDALETALIKALAGHPCAHAYDGVCHAGSTVLLGRVLSHTSPSPSHKGKVTFVLGLTPEDLKALPEGIEAERTGVNAAYNEEGGDVEWSANFYRQIAKWLVPSSSNPVAFRPNEVRVMPRGLESVGEGLELLKSGKVHAEKLVYRVGETPGVQA